MSYYAFFFFTAFIDSRMFAWTVEKRWEWDTKKITQLSTRPRSSLTHANTCQWLECSRIIWVMVLSLLFRCLWNFSCCLCKADVMQQIKDKIKESRSQQGQKCWRVPPIEDRITAHTHTHTHTHTHSNRKESRESQSRGSDGRKRHTKRRHGSYISLPSTSSCLCSHARKAGKQNEETLS